MKDMEQFLTTVCFFSHIFTWLSFFAEDGLAKHLYKKIHGKTDGYHLKKVLFDIRNGNPDNGFSGLAGKIIILEYMTMVLFAVTMICFFAVLIIQTLI